MQSALAPPALWARMVDLVQGHDVIAEIEPHGEVPDMRKQPRHRARLVQLLVDPRGDIALFDLYSIPADPSLAPRTPDLAAECQRLASAAASSRHEPRRPRCPSD